MLEPCELCKGSGKVTGTICYLCNGLGEVYIDNVVIKEYEVYHGRNYV